MLVLSRKVGQEIFVPELGMTVTIIELTRDRVRLGFSAPPEGRDPPGREICQQKPAFRALPVLRRRPRPVSSRSSVRDEYR